MKSVSLMQAFFLWDTRGPLKLTGTKHGLLSHRELFPYCPIWSHQCPGFQVLVTLLSRCLGPTLCFHEPLYNTQRGRLRHDGCVVICMSYVHLFAFYIVFVSSQDCKCVYAFKKVIQTLDQCSWEGSQTLVRIYYKQWFPRGPRTPGKHPYGIISKCSGSG